MVFRRSYYTDGMQLFHSRTLMRIAAIAGMLCIGVFLFVALIERVRAHRAETLVRAFMTETDAHTPLSSTALTPEDAYVAFAATQSFFPALSETEPTEYLTPDHARIAFVRDRAERVIASTPPLYLPSGIARRSITFIRMADRTWRIDSF